MVNIYVIKDEYSFYVMNLFENIGDQITYDNWGLSKSYSVVVGKGCVSVDSITRSSVGIHKVDANTPSVVMQAQEPNSISFCPFLLSDDTMMSDLFPTGTTKTQLINSTSNLVDLAVDLPAERITPQLSYSGMTSPVTFSLSDLETKVLGAI